jgi:PST family polysaccharide transporter/lipopolysaccharide exporter
MTLARRAGAALLWRIGEFGGVKIVYLLRLLILARLLGPEDFGLLAISMIALDVLLKVTDTGMVPALIQHRSIRRSHYDVAWTIGLLRAALVAVAIIAAAPWLAMAFEEPRAAGLMRLLAVVPLLQGTMSIRLVDLHRSLRFRGLATVAMIEAVVNSAVAIALAPALGVWTLAIAPVVAAAAQTVASYLLAPYRPRLAFDGEGFGSLLAYGRWIFLSGVIAVAGSSLLQLVIARQLGAFELGLYFMAARLAFLPSSIGSEVLGAVTFPVFAALQDDRAQARQAMRTSLLGLAAVVGPASLLLIVLAPAIVQHILGAQWAGAAQIIAVLATVNLIGMTGDVLGPAMKGLGIPRAVAVTGATQYALLITFASRFIGPLGVTGAALAWIPAVACTQLIAVALLRRRLPRPFASVSRPLLAIGVVSVATAAAARLTIELLPSYGGVVAATVVGAAVMVAGLRLADRKSGLELGVLVKAAFPRVMALSRARAGT